MSKQNWPRAIEAGDTIQFTPRYHDAPVSAVVVGKTVFPHCFGASTISVYCEETAGLYRLDLSGGSYFITGQPGPNDRQANIQRCRRHYAEHLMRYPVWAERLQNGGQVGF